MLHNYESGPVPSCSEKPDSLLESSESASTPAPGSITMEASVTSSLHAPPISNANMPFIRDVWSLVLHAVMSSYSFAILHEHERDFLVIIVDCHKEMLQLRNKVLEVFSGELV